MTACERHSRPVLRAVLALVVVVDLLSFSWFLGDARAGALARAGGLDGFGELLSRPAASWSVVAIGVAGAIAFALRPGRLAAGALALLALGLLSTAHAGLFGSPWRHLYYSGLCLLGWLIGLAVRRADGAPDDESYARLGATALLGAAYLNAGISKIVFAGSEWVSGLPIQAAVVAQDGLVADSPLSIYRAWAVMTPRIAYLFSLLTVGFELAGPLMIVGRRARLFVALGLFAMHFNIFLLTTHILYWESMVLLLAFGLAGDEADSPPAPAARPRWFVVGATLMAIAAIAGIAHQARRYARARDAKEAAMAKAGVPPAPAVPSAAAVTVLPAPPTVPALLRVGPFAVGDALGEGWSIASLALGDAGFVVTMAGPPGRVRFEITCAESEHRSPFDLDDAHIFYSNDLEYPRIESIGQAVRAHIGRGAGDRDVCDAVRSWNEEARTRAPR